MDNKELYRSIIIANSRDPNKKIKAKILNACKIRNSLSTCNDNFEVFLKKSNKIINSINFQGEGCAISTAALNLLANYLEKETIEKGINFILNYKSMVQGKKFDPTQMKDLIVFQNVHKHWNRVECALIGANIILTILGYDDEGKNFEADK